MRQTHEAESYMYLKAVRATMVLVPLLGIQFVVFPWRPSNKVLGKIYDYLMHSLIHFQVRKLVPRLPDGLFSRYVHVTKTHNIPCKIVILEVKMHSLQLRRPSQKF